MTNQEAFDGIMKWLTRDNGTRCSTSPTGGQCMYYDPITQNRCAIGGHLPLEIAKRLKSASIGIEGILSEQDIYDTPNLDLELVPEIKNFYEGVDSGLLDSLQRLHDLSKNWGFSGFSKSGYDSASLIATKYGLKCDFSYPDTYR